MYHTIMQAKIKVILICIIYVAHIPALKYTNINFLKLHVTLLQY